MPSFVKVGKADELLPGRGRLVEVGDEEIALFNVDGEFHAIDNACTHRGGPLSEGELNGKEVTCPFHSGIFDVTSGAVLGPPPAEAVKRYNVRLADGDIEIEV